MDRLLAIAAPFWLISEMKVPFTPHDLQIQDAAASVPPSEDIPSTSTRDLKEPHLLQNHRSMRSVVALDELAIDLQVPERHHRLADRFVDLSEIVVGVGVLGIGLEGPVVGVHRFGEAL